MKAFYHNTPFFKDILISLTEDESRHAVKVLRVQPGELVEIYNGLGQKAIASIETAGNRECKCLVSEVITQPLPQPAFHIALAVLKKRERTEWFIEKAVELGAARISLFHAARSEKKGADADRFLRVAISALKQSGNLWLPDLQTGVKWSDLVHEDTPEAKYIGYCPTPETEILAEKYSPGLPARILIGPEGDFTPDEVAMAEKQGYISVSLGPLRLRAETAAIAALAYLQAYNHK